MSHQFNRAERILNKDKCNFNSLDILESELKTFLSNYMGVNALTLAVTRLERGLTLTIEVKSDGFIGAGKAL